LYCQIKNPCKFVTKTYFGKNPNQKFAKNLLDINQLQSGEENSSLFDSEEEFIENVLKNKNLRHNYYNLNISRYVDTFEAEENIDIEAIANGLKALDNEMKNIDNSIAAFCKELNISTPF